MMRDFDAGLRPTDYLLVGQFHDVELVETKLCLIFSKLNGSSPGAHRGH